MHPSPLRQCLNASDSTLYPVPSYRYVTPTTIYPTRHSPHETYDLARQSRHHLMKEAHRPGHSLRKLVGHANMLDLLVVALDEPESHSPVLSNHDHVTMMTSSPTTVPEAHVHWPEESSDESEESESEWDSSSDTSSDTTFEDDDFDELLLTRIPSHKSAHEPLADVKATASLNWAETDSVHELTSLLTYTSVIPFERRAQPRWQEDNLLLSAFDHPTMIAAC